MTEELRSPEVLLKDITKGYEKDNFVIVSKIVSDIIEFVRENIPSEMN